MKRRYYSLFCLAALMMLAGCVKEEENAESTSGIPEGALELVAEGSGAPGSKVEVDSTRVYWTNNEPVCVNGQNLNIQVATQRTPSTGFTTVAYIQNINSVATGGHYFVSTPRNLLATSTEDMENAISGSSSTFEVRINAPQSYTYKQNSSGNQMIVGMPMFGVTEAGSRKVTMEYLTAAVSVNVTNSAKLPIVLDKIEVSVGERHQLSGPYVYEVTYSASEKKITGAEPPRVTGLISVPEQYRKVTMTFPQTTAAEKAVATIAATGKKKVQVPILPVKSGARITIRVYAKVDWDGAIASDAGIAAWKQASYRAEDAQFTVTKTADLASAITRKNLVNAPMEVTMDSANLYRGLFRIGPNSRGAVKAGSISGNGRKLTSTEMQYLLASPGVLKGLNTTETQSQFSYGGVTTTTYTFINRLFVDPNSSDNTDNGSFQVEWYRYNVERPDNDDPDRTHSIFYAYEFEDNVVLYPNVYEVSGWYTVNSGGLYTWYRPLSWGTTSSVGSNNASHSYTYNVNNANFYVYVVE